MSTGIPVITQDFLRDRGFKTFMVICPNCKEKWEEIDGKPTTCIGCNRSPVMFTTFDKMRRVAEIDMMPPFLLVIYLRQLIKDRRERQHHAIADFLATRLSGLLYALDGEKDVNAEALREYGRI